MGSGKHKGPDYWDRIRAEFKRGSYRNNGAYNSLGGPVRPLKLRDDIEAHEQENQIAKRRTTA